MELKVINSIPVSISHNDLIENIKNNKQQTVSKRIRNETENAAKEVKQLIKAEAVYKEMTITYKNGSVTLDDNLTIRSKKLTDLLSSCDKAVVFLVTIGSEVEQMIDQMMKNQPHYGYLIDTAASLAAEAAAEYVNDSIIQSLVNDERTTLRYSPGYCDWPISEQRKLFRILSNKEVDIQLSDHFFMSPRKSISGIIGIFSNGSSGFIKNICKKCKNHNCPYRRIS